MAIIGNIPYFQTHPYIPYETYECQPWINVTQKTAVTNWEGTIDISVSDEMTIGGVPPNYS